MAITVYPQKYLDANTQQTKTPTVVVSIEGLDFLSNAPLFSRIRYGDPNLNYGDPGLVYGGLRRRADVRDYISIDKGSLVIQQKVEPEQGRGNISLMTLAFIDKDEYMSQVISPGVLIPEILGKRIRIYLGFQNISFPDDYFTVFRGYVTGTTSGAGFVTLQLSDASIKRKQELFTAFSATLTGDIDAVTLTIPVSSTTGAYDQILGPNAAYDSSVKTYIKIGDEFMEYGPGALSPTSITVLSRGDRGTTAATHSSGDAVSHAIEITGNAYDILLKLMLSGWEGPYLDSVPVASFVATNGVIGPKPNAIVLGGSKDAIDDYGLAVGDYITVSGSGSGNNGAVKVIGFLPLDNFQNNVILTNGTFTTEGPPSAAVLSLRSQFDTLPILSSLKLDPIDVDVATHITIRNNFLSQDSMQFFKDAPESNGKTFLESQIHLPMSSYAVTRYGKISAAINKPPVADQKLPVLDKDTILYPDKITVTRATNNRRLFNEIKYDYDKDDAGNYLKTSYFLDDTSLVNIGLVSQLPIQADGLKTALNGLAIVNRHSKFLLSRYKNGAYDITVNTNWEVGGVIETGDAVLVVDNGGLQITNFNTGKRDLGTQLFEVIDRKLDIKTGQSTLQLLSSPGYTTSDRYATISPSSLVDTATSSEIVIKGSFGEVFPGQEYLKWSDYIGQTILVHSYDWSVSGTTVLLGFDSTNQFKMLLSPPLGFTPASNYIVDIPFYSTSSDPNVDSLYKLIHAHIDPTINVTSGTSDAVFDVSSSSDFFIGSIILVHNADYSILSPEVSVTNIVGTTITVGTSLGFTPASGQKVELIGFADKQGAYRIL